MTSVGFALPVQEISVSPHVGPPPMKWVGHCTTHSLGGGHCDAPSPHPHFWGAVTLDGTEIFQRSLFCCILHEIIHLMYITWWVFFENTRLKKFWTPPVHITRTSLAMTLLMRLLWKQHQENTCKVFAVYTWKIWLCVHVCVFSWLQCAAVTQNGIFQCLTPFVMKDQREWKWFFWV